MRFKSYLHVAFLLVVSVPVVFSLIPKCGDKTDPNSWYSEQDGMLDEAMNILESKRREAVLQLPSLSGSPPSPSLLIKVCNTNHVQWLWQVFDELMVSMFGAYHFVDDTHRPSFTEIGIVHYASVQFLRVSFFADAADGRTIVIQLQSTETVGSSRPMYLLWRKFGDFLSGVGIIQESTNELESIEDVETFNITDQGVKRLAQAAGQRSTISPPPDGKSGVSGKHGRGSRDGNHIHQNDNYGGNINKALQGRLAEIFCNYLSEGKRWQSVAKTLDVLWYEEGFSGFSLSELLSFRRCVIQTFFPVKGQQRTFQDAPQSSYTLSFVSLLQGIEEPMYRATGRYHEKADTCGNCGFRKRPEDGVCDFPAAPRINPRVCPLSGFSKVFYGLRKVVFRSVCADARKRETGKPLSLQTTTKELQNWIEHERRCNLEKAQFAP